MMAKEELIVIDRIEEATDNKGKRYLKVTDKDGITRNIKEGRSNLLTNKEHLLEEGKAIKVYLQDFKTPEGNIFPFVKDFEPVEDIFVAQATEKVQAKASVEKIDSIEAQVSQKSGIEILKALIQQALLTPAEIQECKEYAFSSVRWGMARINLPSVIISSIEEVKGETKKTQTDKTPDTTEQAQSSKQISALEIHTGQDLMAWAKREKGLVPSQVRRTMNWGVKVITEKMAQEAYLKLKETEL